MDDIIIIIILKKNISRIKRLYWDNPFALHSIEFNKHVRINIILPYLGILFNYQLLQILRFYNQSVLNIEN